MIEDNECSICFEKLDNHIVLLNCKHRYHSICIEAWFNKTILKHTLLFI